MNWNLTPSFAPLRTAVWGIVPALVCLPAGASAQVPTVVLQMEQESTSRNVQAQEAGEWAAANGIDTGMLSMIFGQMTDAVGMGLAAAPGELTAMLPADLMTKLQLGGQFAAFKIGSELRDARTPDQESSTATIYITPDAFVTSSGGQMIVWMPAPRGAPGSARMWYGSPGALSTVNLNQINAFVGDQAQHSGIDPRPLPGETRTIAGHSARGYSYDHAMSLGTGGLFGDAGGGAAGGVGPVAAQNVVEGETWIATGLPEAEQVRAFFRKFADSFDGGMMGGQIGVMADLADLGVPLETSETLRTYLLSQIPGSDERQLIRESVSTSRVTDISMVTLTEEELFGPGGLPIDLAAAEADPAATPVPGAPGAPGSGSGNADVGQLQEPCDCSCDAFEELEELDEDDPDAMAKAMCAQQCMARWIGCAQP